MASFHRRKVKVGLANREKRMEWNKLRTRTKKNEQLDTHRGLPLFERHVNSGEVSDLVASNESPKKSKFFQRIQDWHKSRQKMKLKEKHIQDNRKTGSNSHRAENSTDSNSLLNSSVSLHKKFKFKFSFKNNDVATVESGQGSYKLTEPLRSNPLNSNSANEWLSCCGNAPSVVSSSGTSATCAAATGDCYCDGQPNGREEEGNCNCHEIKKLTQDCGGEPSKNESEPMLSPRDVFCGETGGYQEDRDVPDTGGCGPSSRLWSRQPQVMASGILDCLSSQEIVYQEAMYELIVSEQSYLASLNVLVHHFVGSALLPASLGGRAWQEQLEVVFSNVREVRQASEEFLLSVREVQAPNGVACVGVAETMLEFMKSKFGCYVKYCTYLPRQIRVLQELCDHSPIFRQCLAELQRDDVCQKMSLNSFLLLPMQRVTRLPLLVAAILKHCPPNQPEMHQLQEALAAAHTLVSTCNSGARQTEELHEICGKFVFDKTEPVALSPGSRLVRQGELVRLQVERRLGQAKEKRKPYHLFVFSDYILLTRKKDVRGSEMFKVKECGRRGHVGAEPVHDAHYTHHATTSADQANPVTMATAAVSMAGARHALLLQFHGGVCQSGYILLADNEVSRNQWVESIGAS